MYKGTNPEVDSYSVFWDNKKLSDTTLCGQLKLKGVTDIYVCGLAYDVCVGECLNLIRKPSNRSTVHHRRFIHNNCYLCDCRCNSIGQSFSWLPHDISRWLLSRCWFTRHWNHKGGNVVKSWCHCAVKRGKQ